MTDGRWQFGWRLIGVVVFAIILAPGQAAAQCEECEDPPFYNHSVVTNGSAGGPYATSTMGHQVSFTITNLGENDAHDQYNLSCSTSSGLGCDVQTSIGLLQGESGNVVVTFSTGTGTGSKSVTLTATSVESSSSDNASHTVTVHQYSSSVALTSSNPVPERYEGQTGLTATYTVTNTGTATKFFSFTCSSGSSVSCTNRSPTSATLGIGASTTVTATYSIGSAGSSGVTGSLQITSTATYTGGSHAHSASYTVPIHRYSVATTPDGTSTGNRYANSGGHVTVFTVQNTGSKSNTFTLGCSTSGSVTCVSLNKSSVTLAANASTTVNATYSVGATPGTAQLTLNASSSAGPGTSNPGYVTVPVINGSVATTPDGTTTGNHHKNTGGYSQVFSIKNTGPITNTFSLTCGGTGSVSCSGVSPTSVTVAANTSLTTTATYSVGGTVGTGTLTVTASGPGNTSNGGSFNIPIVNGSVATTPDGSSTGDRHKNTNGHTAVFTVQNTGSLSNTFAVSCGGTNGVTCTGTNISSTGVLAPSATANVTATYNVGGTPATGTLTLSATGTGGAANSGSFTVPIVNGSVSTTPDGATVTARLAGVTGQQETFTVTNTGSIQNTFAVTCGGTGVTCTNVSPSSVVLNPSQSTNVVATFTVDGSGSSGTLGVTASGAGSASNSGSVTIPIIQGEAPIMDVEVETLNQGATVSRRECVVLGLGGGLANECGDLRAVHPLPGVTIAGKSYAPTMMYSSHSPKAQPAIYADITLPTGGAIPDTVIARLRVEGVVKDSVIYDGSLWQPSSPSQRIALGYMEALWEDVYSYSVEIEARVQGVAYSSSGDGEFAAINRQWSNFGSGWWLAGYDRLYVVDEGWLLTQGDGGTTLYRPSELADSIFIAERATFPDTLIRGADDEFTRWLPNGTRIQYYSYGPQKYVEDALGRRVHFVWGLIKSPSVFGLLRLDIETVAGTHEAFTFHYDQAQTYPKLDSIVVHNVENDTRTVKFGRNGYEQVVSITSPDGLQRTMTYDATTGAMLTHTDPAGAVTSMQYFGDNLTEVKTISTTADTVINTFVPLAQVGSVTPVPANEAYMIWDGPRTDVGDTTKFKLNQYGQLAEVVNALGHVTNIYYEDTDYPSLATKVVAPNGLVTTSTYDGSGRILSSTDSSTNATTLYRWDTVNGGRINVLTTVVAPEGDSTVTHYDNTTGLPLWKKDARGDSTKVHFVYRSDGLIDSIIDAHGNATAYTYDTNRYLRSVTSPLGFVTTTFKDGWGRDTKIETPIDGTKKTVQHFAYNSSTHRLDSTWTIGPAMTVNLPWQGTVFAHEDRLVVRNIYDAYGRIEKIERAAFPDSTQLGNLRTEYIYDGLGRTTRTREAGDTYQEYDAAGNVVKLTRPGGSEITMEYDALNRLIERTVPERTYTQTLAAAQLADMFNDSILLFPRYPNDGTGWTIEERNDVFAYDVMGNMTQAWNEDARVTRTYTVNGSLATDELAIRDYGGTAFTKHVYDITYGYDLNGRRDSLILSSNMGTGSSGAQTYSYSNFGALQSITNIIGNTYAFAYDALGQLIQVSKPSGNEAWTYDAAGRVTARRDGFHQDTITYDQRGKRLTVDPIGTTGSSASYAYTGMGVLYASDYTDRFNKTTQEYFRVDAMGNNVRTTVEDFAAEYPVSRERFYRPTGALEETISVNPNPSQPYFPEIEHFDYDGDGNVIATSWEQWSFVEAVEFPEDPDAPEMLVRKVSRSYYSADGKLRAHQSQRDSVELWVGGQTRGRRGVFEEYWYDALGRRILKRARADSLCPLAQNVGHCQEYIERYMWDGDQLLHEVRLQETDDNASVTQLNLTSPTANAQSGKITYTHSGSIDQPLDLVRIGLDGVVIPQVTWRGQYDAATDTIGVGISVDWPGDEPYSYYNPLEEAPQKWYGSLVLGQRDASGLTYMRNRYYDPVSGQFTQQDPIGISGGLNVYGFVGGDPANFSDPFGLCPPDDTDVSTCDGDTNLGRAWQALDASGDRGKAVISSIVGKKVGIVENLSGCGIPTSNGCNSSGTIYLNTSKSAGSIAYTISHENAHLLQNEAGELFSNAREFANYEMGAHDAIRGIYRDLLRVKGVGTEVRAAFENVQAGLSVPSVRRQIQRSLMNAFCEYFECR